LLACDGRVVVTGMGKSGIIAHKLAATFSSTGTPAMFLHAADAVHGDLGMVQTNDVVVALSYSGETEELIRLLEAIRRIGSRLIALTGHPASTLGTASDVTLACTVAEEACPMNLAPTASTTATLALGDALAMALAQRKGFQAAHFADLHPGGRLGKRLMRVDSVMHAGDALPAVTGDSGMPEVIQEISSKRLGMTCVIDDHAHLVGVVTDGDLRRHMAGLLDRRVDEVMTRAPRTIATTALASEALGVMNASKITTLFCVAPEAPARPAGILHVHDCLRAGVV
jgi:arabinose-5-phosphate isomerase